jgi:hypothetical protein
MTKAEMLEWLMTQQASLKFGTRPASKAWPAFTRCIVLEIGGKTSFMTLDEGEDLEEALGALIAKRQK